MIWTVCNISIQRLWNNKQECALALVVPVIFFSIFALIFSRGVGQTVSQVRVAFVDDDRTDESTAVIATACKHSEIKSVTRVARTTSAWPIEALSRILISRYNVEVVVHIPEGFTTQDADAPKLSIQLFNEGINPIGHRLVQASLAEAIAMELAKANLAVVQQARPEVTYASATGNSSATTQASAQATVNRATVNRATVNRDTVNSASMNSGSVSSGTVISAVGAATATAAVRPTEAPTAEAAVFQSVNAFASNKHQPKIAIYAAGIAVMFLLFSANGAGASLLEEREAGTLGRLLSSRLTLSELLLGKWLFVTGLGCVQLTLMFLWGQFAFQVDLTGHLPGFVVMTFATSAACASFGLFLAALCRSRQQLHAVSVVLVLTMSAVGGSMVPRYIMSDTMKWLGKFTFNGWALDGFQKIFWYDLPLHAIRIEVSVLVGIALLLGLAARVLAQRWSLP